MAAVADVEFPLKMADIAEGKQADDDIEACVRQLKSSQAVTTPEYVHLKEQLLVKDGVLFMPVKLPPTKVKEVPVLLSVLIAVAVQCAHKLTGHVAGRQRGSSYATSVFSRTWQSHVVSM